MPPIDLDQIRQGRRREWEKLLDPEERQRRKDAERAERMAAKAKAREVIKAEEERKDREQWIRTRRRVIVLFTCLAIAIAGWTGFKVTLHMLHESMLRDRIADVKRQVDSGQRYLDLTDPIKALGSWRSAWLRLSAIDMIRMRSSAADGKKSRLSVGEKIKRLQQKLDQGAQMSEAEIVAAFADPQIVRWPGSKWRRGELAVFASDPVKRTTAWEDPQEWVMVFVWDETAGEWRYHELRKRAQWRERWTHVSQIQVIRNADSYEWRP